MKNISLLVCLVLILSACSFTKKFSLVEPITPEVGGWAEYPYWYVTVSSLQPKFQWNAIEGCTYDLIIYEAVMVQGVERGWDKVASPGEEVF